MGGGERLPPLAPALSFSVEAGTSPGPPHWPRDFSAHLAENPDPTGPADGPWAKIMFEKGTDHLDDKWASRHCQNVRAGETINGHMEAAASAMPELAVFTAP